MATGGTGELVAGRYRLVRKLGHGGMGTVYLAHDERLDRPVALKRMHAGAPADMSRRFQREARVGAALDHPGIVRVYDVVEEADGGVAIAMEYVPGETLADALARGPIDPATAARIVHGIAAALDHEHERGVVHRDVKPANVLVHAGGVKLVDLGVSRAADSTRITAAGSLIGTAAYMAPEQLAGEEVGPAADVYALGLIAYELLAGLPPARGETPLELLRRASTGPPPDLRDDWPAAPPAVAALLQRTLARDPRERPATAGEFARGLERALAPEPTPAATTTAATAAFPPPPPPEGAPSQRRVRVALIGILLATTAVAAAVLLAALPDHGGRGSAAPSTSAGRPGTQAKRPATTAKPTATTGAPRSTAPEAQTTPTVAAATDPADAAAAASTVQSFYDLAARGEYGAAWALLDDAGRALFGNYGRFRGTFKTLESVRFERLEPAISGDHGEVAIATVADHGAALDRCSGTVTVNRAATGWLISRFGVACDSAGAAGGGAGPGKADGKAGRGAKGKGPKHDRDSLVASRPFGE